MKDMFKHLPYKKKKKQNKTIKPLYSETELRESGHNVITMYYMSL